MSVPIDQPEPGGGPPRPLLSLIVHELRNPVAGIRNYQYLLARSPALAGDPDCSRWAAGIGELVQQITELLDRLSEFSRAGAAPLHVEPCDLNGLLMRAVEAPGLPRRPVVEADPPLPVVRCDAEWMQRVFEVLLRNAVTYNRSAEPRVRVGAEAVAGGHRVHVTDNGVGIAAEMQARALTPLTRLPESQAFGPGCGLGLSLAERIVQRHGGALRLESRPGEGTTVSITLPDAGPAA